MTERRFDPITVPAEAGRRRVHRITCSGCGHTDDVSANTVGGSRAIVDLLNVWRRRGWQVGRNPSRDFCPPCVVARRRRGKAPPDPCPTCEEIDMTTVVPMPVKDAAAPRAEPPREMTREDRRIVFARLHEVYLDDVRGYEVGWTDARVADDLGVPRAWVTTIRDENFGPLAGSAEVNGTLAEMTAIAEEARYILATAFNLVRDAEALKADVEALTKRLEDATRAADRLRQAAA